MPRQGGSSFFGCFVDFFQSVVASARHVSEPGGVLAEENWSWKRFVGGGAKFAKRRAGEIFFSGITIPETAYRERRVFIRLLTKIFNFSRFRGVIGERDRRSLRVRGRCCRGLPAAAARRLSVRRIVPAQRRRQQHVLHLTPHQPHLPPGTHDVDSSFGVLPEPSFSPNAPVVLVRRSSAVTIKSGFLFARSKWLYP